MGDKYMTPAPESKAREFWLDIEKTFIFFSKVNGTIHVIEHSAITALQSKYEKAVAANITALAERDSLRTENERLRAALEKIAKSPVQFDRGRFGLITAGSVIELAMEALK